MSFSSYRYKIRNKGWTFLAGGGLGAVVALICVVGVGVRGDNTPVLFSAHPAFAQHATAGGNGFSVAHVAERVLPGVVNIASSRKVRAARHPFQNHPFFREFFGPRGRPSPRQQQGLGSGVIISADGLVVTNNHVVASADEIKVVLHDKRSYSARVVGTDPKSDLAVLKLKGASGLTALRIGDSDALRLGDAVLAVGNPFGVGQTVTMGIVSAKGRANMGIVDYEDFIQTDAAINPGNSGGALVNMRGELVGIPTAIKTRSGGSMGIGFAIPTNMMKPITDALVKQGKVVRGWLGVVIQEVDREMARALRLPTHKGVLISDVDPRGPAKKAGLRRDDLVTAINGKRVTTTSRLRNIVAALGSGKTARLDLYRGKRKMKLNVPLGILPSERSASRPGAPMEDPAQVSGMTLMQLNRATRQRYRIPSRVPYGVVVTHVDRDSAMGRAGLQPGDVLLELNKAKIKNVRSFRAQFGKAEGRVLLLVYRQGSTLYMLISK